MDFHTVWEAVCSIKAEHESLCNFLSESADSEGSCNCHKPPHAASATRKVPSHNPHKIK